MGSILLAYKVDLFFFKWSFQLQIIQCRNIIFFLWNVFSITSSQVNWTCLTIKTIIILGAYPGKRNHHTPRKRPKQRWRRCTMEKHIKTNRTERDVNVRLVTLVHMPDLWIVNSIELWAIWSYISGLNNSKGEWELVYIWASQHHKCKKFECHINSTCYLLYK